MPRLVTDARAAQRAWQAWFDAKPHLIAIDTETTGVAWHDTPFCATVSFRDNKGRLRSGYFDLESQDAIVHLTTLLAGTPAWVGHNLKFDLQKLILHEVITREDVDGHELHDTEAQAHLLNPNELKGLKHLAKTVLHLETDEADVIKAAFKKMGLKKDDGYDLLPREVLAPYALKDTEFTLLLHEKLLPQIEYVGGALEALYYHEMGVTLTLLDIEAAGYRLDVEYVKETAVEVGQRIMTHLSSIRKLAGDDMLNPASPKQLLEAFQRRDVDIESTDAATLKKLDDPLAKAVLEFRGDKKLHTTYLRPLLDEQRDGVIHPSFRQHGTVTGRMSSGTSTG